MRFTSYFVSGFLLAAMVASGQTQREGPWPLPQEREPDFWELGRQTEKEHRIEVAQLKKEADELAKLASGVPSDVDHINKGLLSKDLKPNLKRIEKLSKQIRQELEE